MLLFEERCLDNKRSFRNDLVDWEQAYWGSNFTKLTEVKRAYDPGNVFHFPQSIPLG